MEEIKSIREELEVIRAKCGEEMADLLDGGLSTQYPDIRLRATTALRKLSALEARMQAMEALTSDAIGLVKVLANQVHSLPQAAVSSLTPRTFNEMFNNRDGAAYGQASRILERYELLFAPKSTNPTT